MDTSEEPIKLKRVVIKEELVALTGDYISALILNQFLYWTERMKNIDAFLEEEGGRDSKSGEEKECSIIPTKGFFYKSTEELNKELMLNLHTDTLRKYISKIVKMGYVYKRRNPYHNWDKTFQYRVNILQLQNDLTEKGFSLDGYALIRSLLLKTEKKVIDNLKLGNRKYRIRSAISEITNTEINNKNKIYKKVLGDGGNKNTSKKENIESFQKTKQLSADRKTLLPYLELFPREWQRESKFRIAWAEWAQHKKEIKKLFTELSATKLRNKLLAWGLVRAIKAIDYSIEKGYMGVFEEPQYSKQSKPNYNKQKNFPLEDRSRFEGRGNEEVHND